jgi:signal transduction histidine kinase
MSASDAARFEFPLWLRNRWGTIGLAGIVYTLAFAAWTIWGGEENSRLISNLAFFPASLFAVAAATRAAANPALDAQLRRAWAALGLSLAALLIGDALFTYFDLAAALPEDSQLYYLVDPFYLAFYPLTLFGLLLLPCAPLSRSDRLKFALDLLIVITAAWMVVWYFVVSPLAAVNQSDLESQWVAAVYPIGDLVLLGGIVSMLMRRPDAPTRSSLVIFLTGLACFVAADLINAYVTLARRELGGDPVSIGWLMAYVLFALAAIRQSHPSLESTSEKPAAFVLERFSPLLPFAATMLGYGLVIFVAGAEFSLGAQGVLFSAILLTLFVISRQVVALRENMRLNAELRAWSETLEKRVEQRTFELQQSQEALLASQKLASVGTLAASVVHEVSNPLTTIVTATEAMQGELTDKGQVSVETLEMCLPLVDRAASHATRIVQTLRNYSRGGQQELARHSLTEVAKDALLLMGYQLKGWGNVRLVTQLDPALPKTSCDRNQIAQVIINLLVNARDAMPDGGTVTLKIRRTPTEVILEVTDQGIGIPPESLEKVFDPFYTTKEIGQGSGLGLSIVKWIVQAHKGTVQAHSDGPGRGAAFTVALPLDSA